MPGNFANSGLLWELDGSAGVEARGTYHASQSSVKQASEEIQMHKVHELEPESLQDQTTASRSATLDPPEMGAQVYAVAWDDEKTLCIIVSHGEHNIARRCDNNMINGTKLLNATGMTRGRRDGLLKSETTRRVTKSGPTPLKGVWIPYDRAMRLAQQNNIVAKLYPLFEKDIEFFLYHQTNIGRTQQVVRAASEREAVFKSWVNGIPKRPHSPELASTTRAVAPALEQQTLGKLHHINSSSTLPENLQSSDSERYDSSDAMLRLPVSISAPDLGQTQRQNGFDHALNSLLHDVYTAPSAYPPINYTIEPQHSFNNHEYQGVGLSMAQHDRSYYYEPDFALKYDEGEQH